MTRKLSYLSLLGGVSILSAVLFFQTDRDEDSSTVSLDSKVTFTQKESSENMASQILVEPEKTAPHLSENADENPFEGQEVKVRLQQVAEQFAEEIRYPAFSKPIRNKYELIKYLPNRSIESSRPINLEDVDAEVNEDSPRISLKSSKFRYYQGEQVLAEAQVTGIEETSSISLSAYVMSERKVIASAVDVSRLSTDHDQSSKGYSIRFADLSHLSSGHDGDMDVVAEFTIDGQSYPVSTLIRYPKVVATLESVGSAEVQDEYLMIPINIKTSSPGLFSISGNLYDAESDTPLVHLNAIEELSAESGVIQLKAHIVALKKMGHEGPYELKDISLSRGPSEPNFVMEQGRVDIETASVAGFSFSDYEDVPYVDERAQARLNFLTQLGRTN
ncbi:MAG: hypothetical protein ACMZ64_07435 [Oleiphilus sp.]